MGKLSSQDGKSAYRKYIINIKTMWELLPITKSERYLHIDRLSKRVEGMSVQNLPLCVTVELSCLLWRSVAAAGLLVGCLVV